MKSGRKYYYIDSSSFTPEEVRDLIDEKDTKRRQETMIKKSKNEFGVEDTQSIAKITFIEELTCVLLFLFGVPGAVFSMPIIAILLYIWGGMIYAMTFIAVLSVLSFLPAPFKEESLYSWPALALLRYFSFKGAFTQILEGNRPYILVAPPHGVFPFGNIVTMIAFPQLCGFSFKGLAASAALRFPIFRQLLCTIGVIDASPASATKHLKQGYTLGISTGGVAEVFETDTDTGDEAIVLRERKGLIKLAIRTGTALVPCYLFGNTKLLSLYTGGSPKSFVHSLLKNLSRKLGFATIFFWGRFFLPIPYRVPIVGVMGPPIEVEKQDNPSPEYVDEIQQKLIKEMEILFEDQKENYGWGDKRLLVR